MQLIINFNKNVNDTSEAFFYIAGRICEMIVHFLIKA